MREETKRKAPGDYACRRRLGGHELDSGEESPTPLPPLCRPQSAAAPHSNLRRWTPLRLSEFAEVLLEFRASPSSSTTDGQIRGENDVGGGPSSLVGSVAQVWALHRRTKKILKGPD